MLILHPKSVIFGDSRWENITSIAIERTADRLVVERGDDGAQAIFADVPEELVSIRITQDLAQDDLDPPRCGDQETLTFFIAASGSEGARRRISAMGVVRRIGYQLAGAGRAIRTISLIAISPDGNSDPIASDAADAEI
ncbi:MAG: hypothetical protein IT435_10355 [Phycisphaerales bacterium]|nr:hypothetical protein [Phycisphaerales bacterium]